MRPRPIALLTATLALVAALALALALTHEGGEEAPTHALHQRHRVQLDLPPLDAALWFAARYPDYFTSGEAGLGPWLATLAPEDRDFVLAMGQTLTWAWVEHELAEFEGGDPSAVADEAIAVLRTETLNQLELNVDHCADTAAIEFDAYLGDPEFAAGVFARLVRGVSNCEGQNHLLALLLAAALEREVVGWPAIDVVLVGTTSGHELVQLRGPTLAQPIYVDAWSNLPAFTLDPSRARAAPLLRELGEAPQVVAGLEGRPPFSAAIYAAATPAEVESLAPRHATTKPVDLVMRAPALDPSSLARVKDPWRVYLFARILDLYDDPRAAELYRAVIERTCTEVRRPKAFVCAASTLLLERVEPASRR